MSKQPHAFAAHAAAHCSCVALEMSRTRPAGVAAWQESFAVAGQSAGSSSTLRGEPLPADTCRAAGASSATRSATVSMSSWGLQRCVQSMFVTVATSRARARRVLASVSRCPSPATTPAAGRVACVAACDVSLTHCSHSLTASCLQVCLCGRLPRGRGTEMTFQSDTMALLARRDVGTMAWRSHSSDARSRRRVHCCQHRP